MSTLTLYTNGLSAVSADMLNTFQQTCNTFAQLRSFPASASMVVYALGGDSIADGKQGTFYWSTTATGTDDDMNTLTPYGYTSVAGRWLRSSNANITAISVASQEFSTQVFGYPGSLGTQWESQYHANWNVLQSQVPDNPTEWQIYSNASGGNVSTPVGTNQVTWVAGAQFASYWVGLPYIYIDGTNYKVLAVISPTSLTVETLTGGAVSWAATATVPYYFAVTSTAGTCNVSGTAVTWVSGQPFILYPTTITINGTVYSYTFNSPTSLTLSTSAGTLTGASFEQYCNINNELCNLRLQSNSYLDQENFCITQTANGAILETQYGGYGKYRPIKIRTGEQPAGNQQVMVALYPAATLGQPGTLLLGGDFNTEVLNITCNSNNVNYMNVQGAPTTVSPSISMRGTDTNVGLGIDVKGTGALTVTSHSFGNVEFQVFGNGAASWLGVGSAATAPAITAQGAAANIDINLMPKGTGAVWLGAYSSTPPTATGYITVKDSTGTVRKLLCA